MLPAFKNILRITDHGESTWIGANFLEIADMPADSFGYLTALTRDGYPERGTQVRIDPECFTKGIVSLADSI